MAAIATYLAEIHREATRRGYEFNLQKIVRQRTRRALPVTRGQLMYEWRLVEGDVEPWERT